MKSRHLSILLTVVTCSLFLPSPVAAADDPIFYGDSIPAGITVDHDIVLFGDDVSIEGTVEGNVFILGNQVVVNGRVDGSLVFIAQNASIGGDVTGSIYALALTVDFPAQAFLERDVYAATVSLTSSVGSTIHRHLYALGLDAGLNGTIGGDLHTILGPIQLYNGLMRLLGFDELTLELHFETPAQPEPSSGWIPLRHFRLKLMQPLEPFDWGRWGMALLRSWIILYIFGLLCFFLTPKALDKSRQPLSNAPWKSLGVGMIILVVSFNLFIVGLILFVIVFAIGLGFNFLGLWQLAVLLWIPSFSIIIMAVVGLAFFIAYGSKIILIFWLSKWVLMQWYKGNKVLVNVLILLAGTMVYTLFRSIPYAGWIIDLLVTSAGMGAAWFTYRKLHTNPVAEMEVIRQSPTKKSQK